MWTSDAAIGITMQIYGAPRHGKLHWAAQASSEVKTRAAHQQQLSSGPLYTEYLQMYFVQIKYLTRSTTRCTPTHACFREVVFRVPECTLAGSYTRCPNDTERRSIFDRPPRVGGEVKAKVYLRKSSCVVYYKCMSVAIPSRRDSA